MSRLSTHLVTIALTLAATTSLLQAEITVPDPTDTAIIPGDRIRIRMQEDPDVEYFGEVSAAGTIPVPYLGEFPVTGMTPDEAEAALSDELCDELYNKATISITLVKKALGKVYVYGAVKHPGVVEIPDVGGLTVLQLITAIGGLSRWSAPEEAFILRRDRLGEPRKKLPLALDEIFESAVPNTEKDVRLQPNDIVCIPGISGGLFDFLSVEEAEVFIVGEVRSEETIVTFAPGERRTLFRAILKSGGFNKFAKTDSVKVVRYTEDGTRKEFEIDASAIVEKGQLNKDMTLKQGDMIIVPQKRISF